MSPTILIVGRFRFFFNSREEVRKHVHVNSTDGTAKVWLEPVVALTDFYNLDAHELTEILQIIEEHKYEFIEKWNHYFGL